MKIFFIFVAILMIYTPSYAFESTWNVSDTVLEMKYLTVHTADWLKTKYIAQHDTQYGITNPVLGSNPALTKINLYYLTTGISHMVIASRLSRKYRTLFQYFTLSIERSILFDQLQFSFDMRF